jgi:hypothetical protein
MHSSKFETNISWRCIKVLTTKPLQTFNNILKKVKSYYVWHEIVQEIQFLIYFFFSIFIQILQMKT